MKTIITLLAFLLTCAASLGQGTVDFNNHANYVLPKIDAPFFDDRGIRLAGTSYLVQLYAGSSEEVLVPTGTPVPFLTNGYWAQTYQPLEVVIPPTIVGLRAAAWVQARAWEAAGGPTFEQAALSGHWTGISGVVLLPRTGGPGGGSPTGPVALYGLTYPGNPIIVREPQNQKARAGETTAISVVASGGVALSYQRHQGHPASLVALPSNYHNGAGTVSFADGHAELRKWRDERTTLPMLKRGFRGILLGTPPPNPDVIWLQERTAVWK